MTKTFYTVDYAMWGCDGVSRAYFDNKADAEKFSERDYADKPVRRTLTNPEKIRQYEHNVWLEKYTI